MTETTNHVHALVLDDSSPLAHLFDWVVGVEAGNEAETRRDAEGAASDHVHSWYSETLEIFLDADNWSGRCAVDDSGEPSAVIWLDGGVWLHHTRHGSDDVRDVLTLIAPCACGRGYVPYELRDEGDLIDVLGDLRRAGGRVPHDPDGYDCASVPAAHVIAKK